MKPEIEKVKLFRTLSNENRQKYLKREVKSLPGPIGDINRDQLYVVDFNQLRRFIDKNFPFIKAVPKPDLMDGVLFIPDFKLMIDVNTDQVVPTVMSFHSRMTDRDWTRINVRDLYLEFKGNETKVFLAVYKILISHMSKSLMLCDIYHQMANSYAALGTCNRLSVGALIIKDGRVISTGTNGSPQGLPSCKEEGCLTDEKGRCVRTIHAEQNSLLFCSREGIKVQGSVLYCTDFPCIRCLGMIVQSGIRGIYFERDYDDSFNKKLAEQLTNRIEFYQYDGSMFRLTNPMI